MAETPECAYRAAHVVLAGARLLLTLLYTRARRDVVVAYLEGEGPAPFVFPGTAWLVEWSGISRSQVYDHLAELERRGLAVPHQRDVDGKARKGWTLPVRDGFVPAPVSEDSPEGRRQRDLEAGSPGETEQRDVRPSGNPAERKSGPPDIPVRPSGQESPAERTKVSGRADGNRCSNSNSNRSINKFAAAAVETSSDRRARELLELLEKLYRPDDLGRRFSATNPRHLEIAKEVLRVAPRPGDDPEILADERAELVRGYVTDFDAMCKTNGLHAKWWGPLMLGTTPRPGKKKAAWEMVTGDVDAWRASNRRQRDDAEVIQVRADAARREEAEVTARRLGATDVAAALANAPFMRGLQAGVKREAEAARAEVDDIEVQRRINAALIAAMQERGDSGLTRAEVEDIKRRVRGEDTGT